MTTGTLGDLTLTASATYPRRQEQHRTVGDAEGAPAGPGRCQTHAPWRAIVTISALALGALIILALCTSTPPLLAAEAIDVVVTSAAVLSGPSRKRDSQLHPQQTSSAITLPETHRMSDPAQHRMALVIACRQLRCPCSERSFSETVAPFESRSQDRA